MNTNEITETSNVSKFANQSKSKNAYTSNVSKK